jgi:hypothetical protein
MEAHIRSVGLLKNSQGQGCNIEGKERSAGCVDYSTGTRRAFFGQNVIYLAMEVIGELVEIVAVGRSKNDELKKVVLWRGQL